MEANEWDDVTIKTTHTDKMTSVFFCFDSNQNNFIELGPTALFNEGSKLGTIYDGNWIIRCGFFPTVLCLFLFLP